jgi:RNA polymerase sigma-70 factor (ECF subfamily)
MIVADEEVASEVASYHNELPQSKNLVAAARSGSSAAFAELREIYAPRVYRKLLTMTKNREDAEDALQDTFLQAYKALGTFEERSSFYTWITRIAINSALMILRRRRTRVEISFESPSETDETIPGHEFRDTRPSPEHICVHRQSYACMLRSIWNLQPQLRQVIEMQMMRNYSIREIALALEISEPAVKSRLSRARARLASAHVVRSSKVDVHVDSRLKSAGAVRLSRPLAIPDVVLVTPDSAAPAGTVGNTQPASRRYRTRPSRY